MPAISLTFEVELSLTLSPSAGAVRELLGLEDDEEDRVHF